MASIGASLGVHVFLALAFIFAPRLLAGDRELPEFVAVQIVPSQMLGSSTPTPPQPQVRETTPEPEPAEPEPEPEPVEPEPEPEPERPVAPTAEPVERKPAPPTPRRVETREATPPGAMSQREGSPTGSRLGTSNFGSAVGFDNPDFTYDYYADRALLRIREHWVRPPVDVGTEALVHFRILRDGTVVDAVIERSSGYTNFDLAALRAIQSASPLPPLPDSYDHESVGVRLIVR